MTYITTIRKLLINIQATTMSMELNLGIGDKLTFEPISHSIARVPKNLKLKFFMGLFIATSYNATPLGGK